MPSTNRDPNDYSHVYPVELYPRNLSNELDPMAEGPDEAYWTGKIRGIEVSWDVDARVKCADRILAQQVHFYKAITEHVAYNCARRLGKTSIKITQVG